jgi:hypothetical protein
MAPPIFKKFKPAMELGRQVEIGGERRPSMLLESWREEVSYLYLFPDGFKDSP